MAKVIAQLVMTAESHVRLLAHPQTIFDCLCQQQGGWLSRHPKKEAPVPRRALKVYARSCYKALRANIKRCKTEKQFAKLDRALNRRLRSKKEFLRAM